MLAKYNLKTLKGFIQSKVDKFIDDKCELDEFLYCMIRFLVRTRLWFHENRQSYETRHLTRARVFECYVFRLCLVITFIRFVAPVLVPKKWMLYLVFQSILQIISSINITWPSGAQTIHIGLQRGSISSSNTHYNCFKQRNWTTLTLFTILWWTS